MGPHQKQLLLTRGARSAQARAAMIMVHGRGASAEDILSLADEFQQTDFRYFAPQAAGNSWYPHSFLAPLEMNEPGLSSGLKAIDEALALAESEGFPQERTILLGFSQGACLALEYAFRYPRRYGGVVALSGALITPPEAVDISAAHAANNLDNQTLAETPIFLGCGDMDAHIPLERLKPSAGLMRQLGGHVTLRIYPKMPHTINRDEIDIVREMMQTL